MKTRLLSVLFASAVFAAAMLPAHEAEAHRYVYGYGYPWHSPYPHERHTVIVNEYYPTVAPYEAVVPMTPYYVPGTVVPAAPPVQVTTVRCHPSANRFVAGIAGGAVGGVLGHRVGHGHGNTAATITGALLGAMLGQAVAYPDEACTQDVFESGAPGVPITWQSPQTNNVAYTVMPGAPIATNSGYCREYQATASVGGRLQQTYGTACRQPDGSWQIVN